jgi:hypothetical protein
MSVSKRCVKCGLSKDLEDFYKTVQRGSEYYRTACKECEKAVQRAKSRLMSQDDMRRKNIKSLYNLTPWEYDNLMIRGCEVCGTFDDLCVDHDHRCCPGRKSCGGCIRGVLCGRHNKAEGFLRGSADEARALAEYMERTAKA